ncbi:MAG: hypothetical protein R6X02_23185 [Enhygromyxa sp.]
MFDVFNAQRHCRACGTTWAPGQGAAIQTKLPVVNRMRGYGVGDAIETPSSTEDIWNSGYFSGCLEVERFDDLWILHHWICSNHACQMDNAVLIHIRDGRVIEIESTPLDGDSLRRAHFIDSEVTTAVLRRVYSREFPDADAQEVGSTPWDELFDDLCLGRDDEPEA